jgi:hypothetical protein
MKLIALFSLGATAALCSPTVNKRADDLTALKLAAVEKCGDLGVMDWKLSELPKDVDISTLRKCKKHPSELGITSSEYDPEATAANLTSPVKRGELIELTELTELDKRKVCADGGRGTGVDYDYGCVKGWCWRNCDGPFLPLPPRLTKSWCWLAYDGGNGDWTPCGGWADCEWSYNNKNAKCAKGDCKSCGCGC